MTSAQNTLSEKSVEAVYVFETRLNLCMPANVDRFRGERSNDIKSFNVRHFESSIHTPAKGATAEMGMTRSDLARFDPRYREGSDTALAGTPAT